MKKLPKLYKNENVQINNLNQDKCSIKKVEANTDNINETLDIIFHSLGMPYNKNVKIYLKDKVKDTFLIYRSENNIVTLDNEVIPISEIIKIDLKN